MPYIKKEQREVLDPWITSLAESIKNISNEKTDFAGLLNYCCTTLTVKIMPEKKYWSIATIVGVFKNIADEFYRRIGVKYEEEKIAENGDINVYK